MACVVLTLLIARIVLVALNETDVVVRGRLNCKIRNVADWFVSYSNKGDEKCDKMTSCTDTLESRKLSLSVLFAEYYNY